MQVNQSPRLVQVSPMRNLLGDTSETLFSIRSEKQDRKNSRLDKAFIHNTQPDDGYLESDMLQKQKNTMEKRRDHPISKMEYNSFLKFNSANIMPCMSIIQPKQRNQAGSMKQRVNNICYSILCMQYNIIQFN